MRVFVLAALTVLLTASPAWAHSPGAHGMLSHVTATSPAGIDASVDSDGNTTLDVPSGSVVVVDGYDGEPYLRFANDAVYENTRSPSTYLSKDRPAPPSASASAPPEWKQVGNGTSWTWHDHRAHWMAAQPPLVVREHPKQARLISNWTVRGTIDGRPLRVAGTIRWVPASGGLGWQWLLVPVVAAMLVYIVYLLVDSRRVTRTRVTTPAP